MSVVDGSGNFFGSAENRTRQRKRLIDQSAWFDGSADYLRKQNSLAMSTMTRAIVSVWFQRLEFGRQQCILGGSDGTGEFLIDLQSDDSLRVYENSISRRETTQLFRDIGWYHLVVSFDTTQATANDRIKVYINGEEVTAFDVTNNPTQNDDLQGIFSAQTGGQNTNWGVYNDAVSNLYFYKGLLAQATFLESVSIQNSDQAITDFGEYDYSGNSQRWIPKQDKEIEKLATTAGGNSFALTSAIGDGTDASTNGNDFTPNGMSHAANGSNLSPSNIFPTLNVLDRTAVNMLLEDGNLKAEPASLGFRHIRATKPITGKKYWEVQLIGESLGGGTGSARQQVGVMDSNFNEIYDAGTTAASAAGGAWVADGAGVVYDEGTSLATYTALTVNDHWCLAFDADTGNLWIRDDGAAWWGGGNPSTGTLPTLSGITIDDDIFPLFSASRTGDIVLFKFDQNEWSQSPPGGFTSIDTTTENTPKYQGLDWFNAVTYTGDGTITGDTQNITGVGFSPSLVWIKNRSSSSQHRLYDIVRGPSLSLKSNLTDLEATEQGLTEFLQDGFTIRYDGGNAFNQNGQEYVAWCWRTDIPEVVNTEGSISSNVASTSTSHFSIITFRGTGSVGTVGHGLPGAPEMLIGKIRNVTARSWPVYHYGIASDAETDYLNLDTTNNAVDDNTFWNDTSPTSSVFTVGTTNQVNQNGADFVYYAFRSVPGVCKVGSYTGNSNADGPYVHLGFKLRWLMVKCSSDSDPSHAWFILDTARMIYNGPTTAGGTNGGHLEANAIDAEVAHSTDFSQNPAFDILSDGFKLRSSSGTINGPGRTYIYLAMADVAGNGVLPPVEGR